LAGKLFAKAKFPILTWLQPSSNVFLFRSLRHEDEIETRVLNFDYIEEISQICAANIPFNSGIHVYDTGNADPELEKVYAQFCKHEFLSLSSNDIVEAHKNLIHALNKFVPNKQGFRNLPETALEWSVYVEKYINIAFNIAAFVANGSQRILIQGLYS
jgi:hypothetical protein